MSITALRRLLSGAPLCVALLAGCSTTPPSSEASAVAAAEAASPPAAAADAASAPTHASVIDAAAVAAVEASVNAPIEPDAPRPVDPLRPESVVDLNDTAAQADLWARVRRGFAMSDLDTDLVRTAEQWYSTRPDYVQRMTERGSLYLFHILAEVERRGMPTELALLPFIESAFNPQALSTAKASGMWQFMPGTGRDYDLKQNVFRDDRRDVLASTRAALDYLGRLYTMFGDWHLALAAYNWGEGNVRRAVERNERAGRGTDYLSLRMPNETQYYVPKLQAVKNIVSRPDTFGLALPPVSNHPNFLSVPITRDIDVDVAARLAGMPQDEFKALNPQMNKPVILAAGTPYVLLPYDNANQFVRAVAEHRGPLASWTAWIAPKTLRASEAAKHVGMTEVELREVNRIPPRMLVKSGSTLLVPRSEKRSADVSEHIADNAVMSLAPDLPPARKVSLMAGKKESVASVARRYGLSTRQVAQWNDVGTWASFKPGQTIVIYLTGKTSTTRKTSRAKPALKPADVKTIRPAAARTGLRPAKVSTTR